MTDPQERLRLSREADRLLVEQEVILFPLSYPLDHQAIKPYVKNFQVTPYRYPKLKDPTLERP